MVRYPHTAIISSNDGNVVDGEFVPRTQNTKTIRGRFEASNSNSKIKLNGLGNEVIVRGTFFTSKQQLSGDTIKIAALAIDSKIICIENFQSYTAIYV